ncbi:MAG TPA: hypothetical protein VM598_10905 [Bdellovibrionota bacterium]|nr:hypothetical protein [Bdellovibrionota bacterium]
MVRLLSLIATASLALSCGQVNGDAEGCAQNTLFTTTYSMGVNDDSIGGLEIAQAILIPGTGTTKRYTRILLPLYLGGAAFVGGTMTLSIHKDEGGSPAAEDADADVEVLQSSTVNLNTLSSTTPSLVTFDFATTTPLTVGSIYWLVLSATYVHTSTNVVRWAGDDLARGDLGTYTSGTAKYESVLSTEGWSNINIGGGRALGFQTECENPA